MSRVVVAIISRQNKNNEEEFLLVSSKRDFGEYTGFYYPPAGHVKDGESDEAALKRKIFEELGVEMTSAEKIFEEPGDLPDETLSIWQCQINSEKFIVNHEIFFDINFFTRKEMKKLKLWPATEKLFEI